jgi:PAS domain S-box-containing protein
MPTRAPSKRQEVAAVTLDESGTIVDFDGSVEAIFGYLPETLLGHDVSLLIPKLQDIPPMSDGAVNSLLSYLCQIGAPFRVRRQDGSTFDGRLLVLDLSNARLTRVRIYVWR